MNLGNFKVRKEGAKKGYDLLKSKADALKVCRNDNQLNIQTTQSISFYPFIGSIQRYLQKYL